MNKKIINIINIIFIIFIVSFSESVFSQGVLKGYVVDSITRSPLIGANVFLKGTALGSSTNLEGVYKVTGIPEGSYNIRVSYIGYKAREFRFYVPKSEVTLNINLSPDAVEGEEVIVLGQARGQAAAINQQIRSNTIINVVSEERLQELPDVNAAEVIGRLPGVAIQRSGGEANKVILRGLSDRFGVITVDGIKIAPTDADSRGVDLSTISQGSLAGIELFKALTPDKDADAIAGAVNLVSKRAPSERLLRFDSKGAYNKLNNTFKQYDFSLRYGERYLNDVLGLQISGNIEQRDRSKERTNLDYDGNYDGKYTDYAINNFKVEFTEEMRKRGGFSVLLDINTPDSGSIRINNIYNKTNRDYTIYDRNYPTSGNIDLLYTARVIENEINTFNSSVQGENYLMGNTFNWGFSFAQSYSDNPYDYETNFVEPAILEGGQVISRMKAVPANVLKGPAELLIPYALNNFSKAYLNWGYFRKEKNIDKEKTAYLDISRRYTIGNNLSGDFKLGGKYRYKNRFKESSELASAYYIDPFREYTRLADGTVVKKNFAGTRFSNLQIDNGKILLSNFLDPNPPNRSVYDKYDLFPVINKDLVKLWYELNKTGVATASGTSPEYAHNSEEDADYYDIIERVGAGYLMNTLNIGQDITFIAGLRFENEENDYKAKYAPYPLTGFPSPSGLIKDTSVSHSETVWLPNFHVTYRPFDFMNIRLAAYKALARPDFNDRLEKAVSRNSGSGISGVSNIVTFNVGNANLRSAVAWNYEINTSFFGNDIGLITISAFYKDIKDMFHRINGLPTKDRDLLDSLGIKWNAPFASGIQYALIYPYNSNKETIVYGFEIEHQTNFRFLPGLLQNIVLNYNLSLVKSETYIPYANLVMIPLTKPPWQKYVWTYEERKQRLEGQPELFGNIALGYDLGGFSARVSVFFQGDYNDQFSSNSRADLLQGKFTRWDFVVKQKITDNISVMLNVNNLTSYKEEDYIKNRILGWELLDTSEKYGLTADLGVRITF